MFQSLTIGKRLYLGFGVILLGTLVAFLATFYTISRSKRVNDTINNEINPSAAALNTFRTSLQDVKTYTIGWFNAVGPNDNNRNKKLGEILFKEYPRVKEQLKVLSADWSSEQNTLMKEVLQISDSLVVLSKQIVNDFNNIEDYDDELKKLSYTPWFDETGEIGSLNKILFTKVRVLIEMKKVEADLKSKEMTSAFNNLIRLISVVGIALIIGGVLISYFTIRTIVNPVNNLKSLINTMSTGQIPKEVIPKRNDEIGEMSKALDNLINGFERTTVFANEIGKGQFDTDYTPLSQQDTLGSALLFMRDEIKESRRNLEDKVEERTVELKKQKDQVESLYGQVTDSIRYAKRIQEAIMPADSKVKQLLKESFILYKPKDIVSGDFYWVESKNNKTYVAAVDCTGHGVPGAFMSLLGRNLLNQVLSAHQDPQPADLLNGLNQGIIASLYTNDPNSKDGMDIAIMMIDSAENKLSFAGAINELYLIRNKNLEIIEGDKFYIGTNDARPNGYTNHELPLESGDCLYVFTDGFRDQFGGPREKKFMRKKFNEMLLSNHHIPMKDQRGVYNEIFRKWMGIEEQTDDVLLIGIRF
jgi:serine phosphatase RsbU (regulator of sigma subunit)/HAMP domain-containing protein